MPIAEAPGARGTTAPGRRRRDRAASRPENARKDPDETTATAPPEPAIVSVPGTVYRIALLLVAWYLLVEAVVYGGGTYEPVVIGVCLLLTLMAFALPGAIAALRRSAAPRAGPPRLGAWLRQRVQTASGPLEGREALIQILLIPVSVALGFTLISLVEILTS